MLMSKVRVNIGDHVSRLAGSLKKIKPKTPEKPIMEAISIKGEANDMF